MPATPNPVMAQYSEAAQVDKNCFCPLYNRCLDAAVANKWQNWSCGQCELKKVKTRPACYSYGHDEGICNSIHLNYKKRRGQP